MRFNNKNVILPEPYDDRLRLVALEDNSTVSLAANSSNYSTLQYSLDGATWSNLTTSTATITLNKNQKIFLRGKQTSDSALGEGRYNKLSLTGKFSAEGNIMYLYNYEAPESTTLTYKYSFLNVFADCAGLYYAHKLLLPATTLSQGCYTALFIRCGNLLTTPTLPATTLAQECYQNMFIETNITEAPVLLATTLTTKCYRQMFSGCTSLAKIVSYAQNISASDCMLNWVNYIETAGEFYNLGGATYSTGASGIPSGWTVHTSL